MGTSRAKRGRHHAKRSDATTVIATHSAAPTTRTFHGKGAMHHTVITIAHNAAAQRKRVS